MRYIYYVVAALIFLAVINLSARLIGNDTQELLSDLNPDQAATAAATEATPAVVTPPVVWLSTTSTEVDEHSAVGVQNTEPSSVSPVAAAPDVNSIEVANTNDRLVAAGTAEPANTVPSNAITKAITEVLPETEPQAVVPAEAVISEVSAAVDAITVAPQLVAAAVIEQSATTPITATDSERTTGAVETAEITAVAKAKSAPVSSGPASSAPNSTAANGDIPKVADPDSSSDSSSDSEKPSLIESLGDSAGSAATAVVGGAQQAVETVVEAARALIEKSDSKVDAATDLASKPQPSEGAAQPRIIDPVVAVVAAAVTDAGRSEPKPAAAATGSATQPPTQDVGSTSEPQVAGAASVAPLLKQAPNPMPNPAPVAASLPTKAKLPAAEPVIQPEANPAPDRTVVNTSTTTRELSTAPQAVLELVNRHPGKVLMVGFFSPNCLDCKPSLAWLNEMRRKYWAQGLQVIGVNLGTQAQAKNYLQDAPVSFEILHDPKRELAAAFWLIEQPSTYLIDTSGKLLSKHQGHSASRSGEYEDSIRAALEQR